MTIRGSALVPIGLVLAFWCTSLSAQLGKPVGVAAAQVLPTIDATDRVILKGSVHPLARPEFDIGRSDPDLPMERIILSLRLRPGAQAELDRLLADQLDPTSKLYHRWLTPDEFGARFGLPDDGLRHVTDWLRGEGFAIDEVAHGRDWTYFSGTARQVERAFHTEMHDYKIDGTIRHANALEMSMPRDLWALSSGIVSLNSFPVTAISRSSLQTHDGTPAFTSNGAHFLAPADFAIIYNLSPLYTAGITGAGQTIAIVGHSDIKLSDVRAFRAAFGLPAKDPQFLVTGSDPGVTSDEIEGALDVEWAGAVAPAATIDFVVSANTNSTPGVLMAALAVINDNLAPIMSISFGICEPAWGSSGLTAVGNAFAQAASQGISVLVASGDTGVAGCDAHTSQTGTVAAVNGLCSSSYDVCVGGTLFKEGSDPSVYWSPSNNPATGASALSYIPEHAWNESGAVSGGSNLWASGGGPSAFFAKPSWQVAPGVPADGFRDVPDLALSSAAHDGYAIVLEGNLIEVYGTSAASPSFAGILALVNQKTGQMQGNPSPALYQLGNRQYSGSGPAVFHDVTIGNNTVPGVNGFSAGMGYDLVTGLGSVDAAALVNNWPNGSNTGPCVSNSTTLCIDQNPGDHRFQIQVSYNTSEGGGLSGSGNAIALSSLGVTEGGLFWFFGATNPEMLIKIIDGCPLGGNFWVFYAATTNVGFTITVTDTVTSHQAIYRNADKTAALPIQDTSALSCP